MDFIQEEKEDFRRLFKRFKKRDFSGLSGQAIKNSGYELSTNIVMKIGAFIFTVIIARMLLPELFGLYSLALGTIVLFSSFADLGIGSAAITHISNKLSKSKESEAKKYFKTLLNWKIILLILTTFVLLVLSPYLANNYYNKPIFLALLAGALYLPIVTLTNFLTLSFKASNKFKYPLIKEAAFQVLRLTIVPLGILMILRLNLEKEAIILLILLTIIICYFLSFFLLLFFMRRKLPFLKAKTTDMKKKEKIRLIKFILPLSAITFSGAFFGYIDVFMLGHYVSSEFISYYTISFSLVTAAAVMVGSFSTGLFPIFARIKGAYLRDLLKKSKSVVFILSFFIAIFTIFAAYWIIKIIYGPSFLPAKLLLQIFSALIILTPLIGLYNNYYISQRKTAPLAMILIGSTILTIILNLVAINYGLRFSEFYAVLGACIATIISKLACLSAMILWNKRQIF